MRALALVDDLLMFSRIDAAARDAGVSVERVGAPSQLPAPDEVDLLFVDCITNIGEWGSDLVAWRAEGAGAVRVIAFGSHTDLDAHAAVRALGFGPMWARSRLVRELPRLFTSASR